ncbi:hypothetical protein B0J13DRAFT_617795 [Dactylonectria estremocensis]|uniref:Uncharacterized protein n=1 Tax=Dactylonectria estremocensis TaxID=1079267 RepID=A0A9P9FBY9_9HYPO|nr:hypothetical protein B0J13DRAFT_617795 [Dactylonectria estremocensis]
MLPCQHIKARLVEVESLAQQSKSPALGRPPNSLPLQEVSVLHLSNCAKYSFIAKSLADELLKSNYGPRASSYSIDNDTILRLEWHYLDQNDAIVTTHLVVRDSPFLVILRKQDWEQPIKVWWTKTSVQRVRERATIQLHQKDAIKNSPPDTAKFADGSESSTRPSEIGSDRDSETESVASECSSAQSSSSKATSVATVTAVCARGDGSSDAHEAAEMEQDNDRRLQEASKAAGAEIGGRDMDSQGNEDKNNNEYHDHLDNGSDWSDMEMVETKLEDSDSDDAEEGGAYWSWSPEEHRWYHEHEDKPREWFPRLV